MFPTFSLTLMVNHACNLRCTYCYTGAKFRRPMTTEIATAAIRRAVQSTAPGGQLELGFFGGEPLLEAASILEWVEQAREQCAAQRSARSAPIHGGERSACSDPIHGVEHCTRPHEWGHYERVDLRLNLTTNGTIVDSAAWRVMSLSELHLSISHDGLPHVHDRHRHSAEGHGSSAAVLATLDRLLSEGRDLNVVMVVRPDNLRTLVEGIEFLRARGVRQITPSLDLWTEWTQDDAAQLQQAVSDGADLWRRSWPDLSISWFDEKTALLARVPMSPTARCHFGHGQIAVSPAGFLYPCERLIGEDRADHPLRLPGHALAGDDFCSTTPAADRSAPACSRCALESLCGTSCRCSNFIRTGDATKPDGLLCWLETLCFRETARVLNPCPTESRVLVSA
ncbi:MAG: radical SAM protein [Planctomycetaceae bacterium]